MIDIKALRKNKKMSQSQFADIFKVSQSYISQVENGSESVPEDWEEVLKTKFGDISKFEINENIITNNITLNDDVQLKYIALLEEIAEERKQKHASIDSIFRRIETMEARQQEILDLITANSKMAADERGMLALNQKAIVYMLERVLAKVDEVPVQQVRKSVHKILVDAQK